MGKRKYKKMFWPVRVMGKHNHVIVVDLVVVFMIGQSEKVQKGFFEKVSSKFKPKL